MQGLMRRTPHDANNGERTMKTFKLIDKHGFTRKFTVHASGNVSIESFDRDGRSMGWPFTTDTHGGRCDYRKCIKKFGMKPV
jgi:hypothetical protein